MALVTIQVLEGLERGRVYRDVQTPITIGREDENAIQLNDERVSRFHAKMQDDGGKIILTDLDSTNGTRVNGHPIQLRVLRAGDQVGIGRCLLLFGSDTEIRERGQSLAGDDSPHDQTIAGSQVGGLAADRNDDDRGELFPSGPPELPQELTPIQRAQLSDLISYAHNEIRKVLEAGVERPESEGTMRTDWSSWQQLVQLEKNLAVWLRSVAEPEK